MVEQTNPLRHVRLVLQPRWMSTESYSLVLLVISSSLYSVMACFVKLAVVSGIPSTEQVFLRALFQGFLVVVAMFWFEDPNIEDHFRNDRLIKRPFGSKTVRFVVIARGIVGGLGFCLYYYTISLLPLGDAVTILSLSPVVTIVAAALFLKETIRYSHIFATLASLVGSILLAKPSFLFGDDKEEDDNTSSKTGYVTAFMGACCGATVYILIRRAGKAGVHTLQLLFSWSTFGVLYSFSFMMLPVMIGGDNPFVFPTTPHAWWYLLGVCVFGCSAHFLLNYAARHAPAGLASIIRSSGIMWSYLLEILVFHQVPHQLTVLGVSLIVLSLLTIAVEKHYSDQNTRRTNAEEEDEDLENIPLTTHDPRFGSTYGSTSKVSK